MEKKLTIPIPGTKKKIYAKQRGSCDRPVVVFVHGLTGFMDEHQFYNGARYFDKKGFSSVRFNLYDYPEDARKLIDCTLEIHAHDVDTVLEYVRKKGAQQIVAIGHSYGSPSIILSSQKHIKAAVLWDGTSKFIFEDLEYFPEAKAYRLDEGVTFLIGKKMYDEGEVLKWDSLVDRLVTPAKFIWAEKSGLAEMSEDFYEKVRVPKEKVTIAGAEHTFSEGETAMKLYDESYDWIKKFIT